ncbi:MAG TPA: BlaI/MecI/CopY family transcriptional regulator [Streptosporangiaceae bacterium]|nr:BlaI/MecI/CopY family transcriptional regulator [Streptosporangiaceae bacterium]
MSDHRRRPMHGDPDGAQRRAAGALEAEVLAVLQDAGTALNPGQVRECLASRQSELSYSTVVTIMSRLHAKGLLARERAGRAFVYTALDPASLAAGQMSRALDAGADHRAVLTRFASTLSGRDARLLRQLLDDDTPPAAR